MPKFKVEGENHLTGKKQTLIYDVEDESQAEKRGLDDGLIVKKTTIIKDESHYAENVIKDEAISKKIKQFLKGFGILVSIIIITCAIVYFTAIHFNTNFGINIEPAGTISARNLYSEYEANEVAADQKYKNNIISIYGKVESIDTLLGFAYVTLKGKMFGGTKGVQCCFSGKEIISIASLSKGQYVVVEGKCKGMSMFAGVQFVNCRIIK